MGEGEDHMEVACRQQPLRTGAEPADLLKVLTLGAVPVPARVEREAFVPAVLFTTLQMTPEGRGAAVGDIPEDLALFAIRGTGLEIGLPVAA